MLIIHKWITGVGIRETDELEEGCWVNLFEPMPDELTRVTQTFRLPPTFLTDPLDKDERSRVELDEDDNCVLIVLRVPYHDTSLDSIPFITVPFGTIIAPLGRRVTVCAAHGPDHRVYRAHAPVCRRPSATASPSSCCSMRRCSSCATCGR